MFRYSSSFPLQLKAIEIHLARTSCALIKPFFSPGENAGTFLTVQADIERATFMRSVMLLSVN